MISTSAFARSRPLMARYDVSMHMTKWWKAHRPDDGQISRHLSPYEQQIFVPWLKTFPKRAWTKFSDSGPYLIGTFVLVYGTVVFAEAEDQASMHRERF